MNPVTRCCVRLCLVLFSTVLALVAAAADPVRVASPDGRIVVEFTLTAEGAPRYRVLRGAAEVLRESRLGLVRDDADFTRGLRLDGPSGAGTAIEDRYALPGSKRRENVYRANRRDVALATADGRKLVVRFQVSDDGVAFRYEFPEADARVRRLSEEATSFRFAPEARAWLQPMSVAKTGWKRTNPSYEEYYERDVPVGTPSSLGAGWVFPALFRTGDTWVLLSESGLGRNYCGTRLRHESPDGEYAIGFPDPREGTEGGAVNPESTLPWRTPWRVIVVGSLATIVESQLGLDVADAPAAPAAGAAAGPVPGKASWSWPLLGDDRTEFATQRRFIDYAAEMGWRYCLIDALWDTQIGEEKLRELCAYAATKDVRVLVWYNSAGGWNDAPQTPRGKLLTREQRAAEFAKLKAIGVAGLKVDFFGGDGQSMIAYYHDLLAETAPYGFAMNFHGATLPRGWSRTYPHLLTVEAIRGLEFATFEQVNADRVPAHAAMLPFTRNVFDPMDFTPVALDALPRTRRVTTSAAELAQAVLFVSALQHYGEVPEGLAKAPDFVRAVLRDVPSVWDDVKFLAGEPGKYVVLARRAGTTWWLAGLNGENAPRELALDLAPLAATGPGELIADGPEGNLSFRREEVDFGKTQTLRLMLPPRGGFVARTP